jgi:hypothetical protein
MSHELREAVKLINERLKHLNVSETTEQEVQKCNSSLMIKINKGLIKVDKWVCATVCFMLDMGLMWCFTSQDFVQAREALANEFLATVQVSKLKHILVWKQFQRSVDFVRAQCGAPGPGAILSDLPYNPEFCSSTEKDPVKYRRKGVR